MAVVGGAIRPRSLRLEFADGRHDPWRAEATAGWRALHSRRNLVQGSPPLSLGSWGPSNRQARSIAHVLPRMRPLLGGARMALRRSSLSTPEQRCLSCLLPCNQVRMEVRSKSHSMAKHAVSRSPDQEMSFGPIGQANQLFQRKTDYLMPVVAHSLITRRRQWSPQGAVCSTHATDPSRRLPSSATVCQSESKTT
ncbi:hypothetical protein BC834DRAFT_911580 [Gloeopeniophorella convolvens]|nr:hypothetical protein BC834DRAFT_911580 [Gloeopeniophorella convolvens]